MVINDTINLLKEFGYPFLFVWSILEGEIGLILAGWLSQKEIFSLIKVIFITISGAMIGDIIVFFIGKFYSKKANIWLNKNPQKKERLSKWIDKYGGLLILFERFIYGTHIPLLLTFGISGYDTKKWLILDIIGVIVWSLVFVSIGYFFGDSMIETILFFQKQLLILVLIILGVIFLKK
jgi:membrane protein DedA with SNARE-associated domain